MKGMSCETYGGHLRVGDGHAVRIAAAVEFGADAETERARPPPEMVRLDATEGRDEVVVP
jgi:hypothetical protein